MKSIQRDCNNNKMFKIIVQSTYLFFLAFLLFSSCLFAQGLPGETGKFPLQDSLNCSSVSGLITFPGDSVMIIWMERTDSGEGVLNSAVSDNNGLTWNDKKFVTQLSADSAESVSNINGIRTSSGRIVVGVKIGEIIKLYISEDMGTNWVMNKTFMTDIYNQKNYIGFFQYNDSTLWCTYEDQQDNAFVGKSGRIIRSFDHGVTWSDSITAVVWMETPFNQHRYSFPNFYKSDDTVYAVAAEYMANSICILRSIDEGFNWEAIKSVSGFQLNYMNQMLSTVNSDTIKIFCESNEFDMYPEIWYLLSNDGGQTFSEKSKLTNYYGEDHLNSLILSANESILSFSTNRNSKDEIWLSYSGSQDNYTPPFISDYHISPPDPIESDTVIAYAKIHDDSLIVLAEVKVTVIDSIMYTLALEDNGIYPDETAGDRVFTGTIGTFKKDDIFFTELSVYDDKNYLATAVTDTTRVFHISRKYFYMDINNLKLPMDNKGTLADIRASNLISGGKYDNNIILFSAGFIMSGFDGDSLWAFAQASASRITNAVPGPVGSDPSDIKNRIYIISASDTAFGSAWQEWKFAVEQGADFYDGDRDSLYNPIDKNENGLWDPDEDKPAMYGDVTAFCVYNDNAAIYDDTWEEFRRKGIEVRQTAYAFDSMQPELANSIFIRYEVVNTGIITPVLDSVYFGSWADPDIGSYNDDLAGSDTLLQTGYAYNMGNDDQYATNPPAIFISFFNSMPAIEESMNEQLTFSSFMHYIQSHVTLGDPQEIKHIRYYNSGLNRQGEHLDPCNWGYGTVYTGNCNDIDPKYWYSGSPIHQTGWVNTLPDDQRIMMNSTPFTLAENEPVELYVAYTVARGTDALNSVSVGKEYIANLKGIPWVGLDDNKKSSEIPTDFALSQNYPNPFNPVTTINYQLPAAGKVTLKVYNILGQEVKTLVNEVQEAGYKTVEFDASKLASGVYIYRIEAGSFTASKKMILLK